MIHQEWGVTTESSADVNQPQYIFDNTWHDARQRLAQLEAVSDPDTIRRLQALGVGLGWQCLEVGAGGGSMTQWLCQQVGPTGKVVATDINTRFLEALAEPNLEVRQHNIVTDALEPEHYDLVYARQVLLHIPERETALARMVAALKPGGWLYVEDSDMRVSGLANPEYDPEITAFAKQLGEKIAALNGRADLARDFGRRLFELVRGQGLVHVASEDSAKVDCGGSAYTALLRGSMNQLRPRFLSTGLATDEEVDRAIQMYDNPNLVFMSPLFIAAWGQKPKV
jgi:SAM-dependent methyltransferase